MTRSETRLALFICSVREERRRFRRAFIELRVYNVFNLSDELCSAAVRLDVDALIHYCKYEHSSCSVFSRSAAADVPHPSLSAAPAAHSFAYSCMTGSRGNARFCKSSVHRPLCLNI